MTTAIDDPLSASLSQIRAACAVGFDSAYLAAQEALKGYKFLPEPLCNVLSILESNRNSWRTALCCGKGVSRDVD